MSSKPDEREFSERLRKYGLTPDDVQANTLRVVERSIVYLGDGGSRASFHAPRWLRCRGIDDAKRWLGVPDKAVRLNQKAVDKQEVRHFPPASARREAEELTRALASVEPADTTRIARINASIDEFCRRNAADLARLARSYVLSDSKPLKKWKLYLDLVARQLLVPIWAYETVVVKGGSVLEFSGGANVLTAGNLVIESGGTIRCRGTLNLDVGSLTRS